MPDVMTDDIQVGRRDSAGQEIILVYARDPDNYAVYRTTERAAVEFSDKPTLARRQRVPQERSARLGALPRPATCRSSLTTPAFPAPVYANQVDAEEGRSLV